MTDIIHRLDSNPLKKRPVTFWFYSDSEANLYRAAHELQQEDYSIQHCGPSDSDNYMLIITKVMVPEPEKMDRLFHHFEDLGQRTGVTFDSWEMVIEME